MNKNKTPGVRFITKSGTPFFVDVLWAMVIGSMKNLNKMLEMEQDELNNKLLHLSLHPLMMRYYSVAGWFINKKKSEGERKESKIIDWYYHKLSPTLVPIQLKNPVFNRILTFLADMFVRLFMLINSIPNKKPEEIFEIKNELINYKSVHYSGMSNKSIKKFLETAQKTKA